MWGLPRRPWHLMRVNWLFPAILSYLQAKGRTCLSSSASWRANTIAFFDGLSRKYLPLSTNLWLRLYSNLDHDDHSENALYLCRQKVTLMLLDQGTGGTPGSKHLVRSPLISLKCLTWVMMVVKVMGNEPIRELRFLTFIFQELLSFVGRTIRCQREKLKQKTASWIDLWIMISFIIIRWTHFGRTPRVTRFNDPRRRWISLADVRSLSRKTSSKMGICIAKTTPST